jgi:MYXO-CTERM domain-containing protein
VQNRQARIHFFHLPPKTLAVAEAGVKRSRAMLGITSWLALAGALSAETPTQEVYGGTEVVSCGWPSTVSLEGSCTGTLVHPQVVIYAQHCGSNYGSITFGETIDGAPGRTVGTQFCSTYPGGGPGSGRDFAVCVLDEPQYDIPIVPILMGCETSVLSQGRQVTAVGFGEADTGPYGIKREVTMDFGYISSEDEAFIGGGGEDTCQGDSGGPVFVQLSSAEGGDDTWRVFGITSYGSACGGGGFYSMMHIGMDWFESESGFDLTPCHDATGTWTPTPECGDFPLMPNNGGGTWAEGCNPGALGGLSAICGAPFDASSDVDPPIVAITTPATGSMFTSDPGTGQASFPVVAEADDGMGYGVDTVRLLINGMDVPGGELSAEPYAWNGGYPAGQYTFQVIATDVSGNVAESEIVYVGVDMEAPEPPVEGEDESGSGSGSGGGVASETGLGTDDGDEIGGTGDETAASGLPPIGGDDGDPTTGCGGCRSDGGAPGAAWVLGGLGLLGLRRRRRG